MNRSSSELYSEAFEDLKSNPSMLVPVLLTNLLYVLISLALGASIMMSSASSDAVSQTTLNGTQLGRLFVTSLILVLVELAGLCLLQCMAVEVVKDGRTSLAGGFRSLGEHIVPFIGAALIATAIILVVAFGGFLIVGAVGLPGMLVYFLGVIATSLFVSLAFPAVAYSDLGPLAAISDSFSKVKANFMHVLGFAILTFILAIGMGILSGLVGVFLGMIGALISLLLGIFFSTLVVVALTHLYDDIARKEAMEYALWRERLLSNEKYREDSRHQSWQQPLGH